jgi:hypothetical protein
MILQNTITIFVGLGNFFECGSVSRDQSQTRPGSCSPFETPKRMPQFSFLVASSHHLLHMNFNHFFLLLLVVLSAYSEGPQLSKPPDIFDPTSVTVCPNSSSVKLGVLAPVLPQNEVFELVPAPSGVLNVVLIPSGMLKFALPQNEVYKFVLPQDGVFKSAAMSNNMKFVASSLSNVGYRSLNFLTSILMHGVRNLAWSVRILLESLQHVLKMYAWSLSENQASIQFKCRLLALMVKQSLFRKHDFVVCAHKIYYNHQTLCFLSLTKILCVKKKFTTCVKHDSEKDDSEVKIKHNFYGGGKALIFSSDELHLYVSANLHEQQYQFLGCVNKNDKQKTELNDGDVLCSVPLNILAPKLTLKSAKELANLHDMYMPSKILLKNAQILLESHKCETCPDLLAVFKPYKVVSTAERQQTWYQKNKEKRAEYNKKRALNSEYQESHKKSSQKHRWSKKDVKFPPPPPSLELSQNIISDFCADTSPDVLKKLAVQFVEN